MINLFIEPKPVQPPPKPVKKAPAPWESLEEDSSEFELESQVSGLESLGNEKPPPTAVKMKSKTML